MYRKGWPRYPAGESGGGGGREGAANGTFASGFSASEEDFFEDFFGAFADDSAADLRGDEGGDVRGGDLDGVTAWVIPVGVLRAVTEDAASPASLRRGVPSVDFAYLAWRSTSDNRRGVSASAPSLTRTPDRGWRVAPGTPSYGEGAERARVGVGVVRAVAERNGDDGGLPNVPAVEVGAPVVDLRAPDLGADVPSVLDVDIAPSRALSRPASARAYFRAPAPSSGRADARPSMGSDAATQRRCIQRQNKRPKRF